MTTTDIARAEGYTVPAAGLSMRSRVKRYRWVIAIGIAFVLLLALTLSRMTPTSTADLSTWNPKPNGAMAVAEILRHQGVSVEEVAYLSHIRTVDTDSTTLVITLPGVLTDLQVESILDYPGDLVFIGISHSLISHLDSGLLYRNSSTGGLFARCSDPDATAAGTTTASGPLVASPGQGTVCFADDEGYGTYLVLDEDGRRIVLLGDPLIAMNRDLDEEGNAALVLRSLGKHPTVLWYAGAFDDTSRYISPGSPGGPGSPPGGVEVRPGFLPAGTGDALFALGLAGMAAAFWKGRRMGPLVTEPLPVVVHASESTRGRGRLYRRARAYGRASAALRAAAAERMGKRLGVPRSADAAALVAAIARASERDPRSVERLLYGPPPGQESDMMALANELDALEREVHRP